MRSDLTSRYTIGEPAHENEFVVYPATDTRTGWSVFIVTPDVGLKADKVRADRVWTSVNEAKFLQQQRFVEIVDLLPPVPGDDNFYIVEKRPSKTLRDYFEEHEAIAFDRATEVIGHILEGVATLHGVGYAHNALTDQCIYVSEDFSGLQVRLGDLHLISRTGEPIIPPYAPEFAAPELYRTGRIEASASADVYSVGMLAYKLLLPRSTYRDVFSNVFAWEEPHQREQIWKNLHLDPSIVFPRLETLLPGFPANLAAFVESLLARDPALRPRDCVEALGQFRQLGVLRLAPTAHLPERAPAPPKRSFWTPAKLGLAAAALVIWLGAGAGIYFNYFHVPQELIDQVDAWRKEAENRKAKATAAGVPARGETSQAKASFAAGASALDEGVTLQTEGDYETALAKFETAVDDLGNALLGAAREDAVSAREAAAKAGGEPAPAFADAATKVGDAEKALAAEDLGAAITAYQAAKTGFDTLATDLGKVAEAKTRATAAKDKATRMAADALPAFAPTATAFATADTDAAGWKLPPAADGFAKAADGFEALIAEILAAKDEATTLRQKVADLAATIATRLGPEDPLLADVKPRIASADGRFEVEAFKAAVAEYGPIAADLERLIASGFCPAGEGVAFERLDAGAYSLSNVRLMTSSLSSMGPMLGVSGSDAKIGKPLCVQPRLARRADIAGFLAASGNAAEAEAYRSEPDAPATDVPWTVAESYLAWLSDQLKTPVRLPTAAEWMVDASRRPPDPLATNDFVLEWTSTPCEGGGYVGFLRETETTFAVCSDPATGGVFRPVADVR
ncbi:protein kinase domain-containing protein [Chthonobacter albigriseus]|uniref:protein kinase domain-containing protein n=1 Tax=Chthonobacter albigriseus TaxID=1683161 RepID=UPI0015EF4D39|nr:SUMF1/EgtB/PvdO family nonheme iron enzyme [Chthonobacter albigriseus]